MNWWRCLSSEQETPCFLLEKNMMMIMNHSRAISWESNIICHKNEHLGCRMENQFSSLLNHPSFISHLSWAALASYTINFWSSWKSMRLCCCSKIKFGSICYLPNKERRGPCHIFSCMVTWPCSLELDKHWWMLLFFFKKISLVLTYYQHLHVLTFCLFSDMCQDHLFPCTSLVSQRSCSIPHHAMMQKS